MRNLDINELKEIRRKNLNFLIGWKFGSERGFQSRAVEFIGKPQSLLSGVLKGSKGIGEELAREMEVRFNLNLKPGYLDDPELPSILNGTTAAKESSLITVDQYNVRGSLGHGSFPADYIEVVRTITLDKNELMRRGVSYSSPDNLSIITGWGDSMIGTIEHGDLLLVDRGITSFTKEGVYLLSWDGDLYVKRVQKASKDKFLLISDNDKYKPIEADICDVIIQARVLITCNMKIFNF